MTESKDGRSEGLSPPVEEKPLRQAATRLTQAVTGSARAISGSFLALVGKSSGSIRAIERNAAELYQIAPDVIRGVKGSLDEDDVNEIISNLVRDELSVANPEWAFLREPERRNRIATDEIRKYLKTLVRGRRLRQKGAEEYWDKLSDNSIWANPLSRIYLAELEAAIDAVLSHMSDARRAIYLESFWNDLTLKEIAEKLGRSIRSVTGHKVDANRIIRAAIAAREAGRQMPLPKKGRPRSRPDGAQQSTNGDEP